MTGRITNREPEIRLPLPQIGKIKVGLKGDNGLPKSVDYFIPRSKYGAYFTAVYGEKPQTLQIIFMDDNPELSCPESWVYRDDAGALVSEGDGTSFRVWSRQEQRYLAFTTDDRPNLMDEVIKAYPAQKSGGWRVTLKLRFILPRISGVAGYWEFETRGNASSIPAIRESFDAMLQNRGFVKGLCFDLNVAFAKSNHPDSKSRFPVVSLVANHSAENIELVKGSIINYNTDRLLT